MMRSVNKIKNKNKPDAKSSGHVRSPSRDQAHDARRRLRACPPRHPYSGDHDRCARSVVQSQKLLLVSTARAVPLHTGPESRVWCSNSQPGVWRKRTRICFSRARVPVDWRRLARDHAVTLPAPQVARFLTLPPLSSLPIATLSALPATMCCVCLSFARSCVCSCACGFG